MKGEGSCWRRDGFWRASRGLEHLFSNHDRRFCAMMRRLGGLHHASDVWCHIQLFNGFFPMRTTLVIDDDVLRAAKEIAATERKSVGAVISSLARRALTPAVSQRKSRNGIPLLNMRRGGRTVSSELVHRLREELPWPGNPASASSPGPSPDGVIVVADTSPLNYLIQIQCEHVLPRLYRVVVVPLGVIEELRSDKAPLTVKAWLESIPSWLEIRPLASTPNPELNYLGRGEREAIQLAEEQRASLLLIDEHKGQSEAARRGLSTTGTLGVLLDAGEAGLIDPRQAYRRLIDEPTFRTSPALEGHILRRSFDSRPTYQRVGRHALESGNRRCDQRAKGSPPHSLILTLRHFWPTQGSSANREA